MLSCVLRAMKGCFTQHRKIQQLQGTRKPFKAGIRAFSQKLRDSTSDRCLGEDAEEESWGVACVLVVRPSARWNLHIYILLSVKKVEI